jgi:hypothetical protein
MDDLTIRPPVDFDFVQIFEMMQSSRALPIPQISPGDKVVPGVGSIDPSDAILPKKFSCPDDYVDAPEDPIDCVPSPDHDAVEIFIRAPMRYPSMFIPYQESLRTNKCFD